MRARSIKVSIVVVFAVAAYIVAGQPSVQIVAVASAQDKSGDKSGGNSGGDRGPAGEKGSKGASGQGGGKPKV